MTCKYRAVLIGCGAIGSRMDEGGHMLGIQTHAAAYQACPRTELVGVCDVDIARAATCAKNRNVTNYYREHRAMMESCAPDVVSIATETSSHDQILKDVLSFPGVKLVICEKPIARDSKMAVQLVRMAEDAGCSLVVNYCRHFLPIMAQIRKSILDEKIGIVRLVNGFYTKTLAHNGTHLLDLLYWWFGDLSLITAQPASWATGCSDYCNAQFELTGRQPVYLHALNARDYSLLEIDIIGSSGRIKISHGGNKISFWQAENHTLFAGYREFAPHPTVLDNCLQDLMAAVVDTALNMLEGDPDAARRCCSGKDALVVLKLAEDTVALAGANN